MIGKAVMLGGDDDLAIGYPNRSGSFASPPPPGQAPDQISGLQAWYKADALALNNNDPISSWADSSAGGNTLTQATGSLQPLFKTNVLNGKPAVQFDGTDDYMTSALSTALKPVSIVTLVNMTNFSTNRVIHGPSAASGLVFRIDSATGLPNLVKAGSVSIGQGTAALSAATWAVLIATYSGTGDWAHSTNNSANGSGTNDQTLSATTLNLGRLGSNNTQFFIGQLAEHAVYNKVLSTQEQTDIYNYLRTKYGI